VQKHVETPVGVVGGLTNPEMMEELIASGKADVMILGRQSLADPDLPVKARMGKEEEVMPCLRCFTCFSNSTIGGVFYCAVNPEIGREQAYSCQAAPSFKKTVLVAGGGVGGMQAALTAAKAGHNVILCEKGDRLGGVLLCEEKVPFKHNLSVYLKRQAKKVENSSIQLKLNTEVTPELVNSLKPDAIIAAMGARPVKPAIEGIEGKHVLGAEDAYYHPETVGKKVVIVGGGLVGLELGIFLAQNGHDVNVVEMAPGTLATPPAKIQEESDVSKRMSGLMGLPGGYPLVHGVALTETLKTVPNMKVNCLTKAVRVLNEGLLVEGKDVQHVIEADTVIYAVGVKPLCEEALALADCAPEFYQIGDCIVPDNIYAATSVAHQIALDLGRF
jgi:pyruvate/2-oxoglutarate dehydrogenase complex dihydrolipoamide dehydrogenase (E3) component